MPKRNKKNGYTLIEILAASLIFVLVVVISAAAFTSSTGSQGKTQDYKNLNRAIRYGVNEVNKDVYNSRGSVKWGGNNYYGFIIVNTNGNRVPDPNWDQARGLVICQGDELHIYKIVSSVLSRKTKSDCSSYINADYTNDSGFNSLASGVEYNPLVFEKVSYSDATHQGVLTMRLVAKSIGYDPNNPKEGGIVTFRSTTTLRNNLDIGNPYEMYETSI